MTTIEVSKAQKRRAIMEAAYACFLVSGVTKTSIDAIVQRAGVAKGTFYLYFKDKTDLAQQIFTTLSRQILLRAYEAVTKKHLTEYIDNVIAFVDEIVEYFRENKQVLALLERNFSWPFVESHLNPDKEDEELQKLWELLLKNPYQPGKSREEISLTVFSIVALCGSVCYSSILKEEPAGIDRMKPTLYRMIRKILQ